MAQKVLPHPRQGKGELLVQVSTSTKRPALERANAGKTASAPYFDIPQRTGLLTIRPIAFENSSATLDARCKERGPLFFAPEQNLYYKMKLDSFCSTT